MSKITKKVYPVMGMHCAACANNVEKIVKKQEGVEDASVNLAAAVLTVDFNSDVVSPEQLKDAVMKIGFDLIIDEDNSMEEQEEAEHSYYEQLQRKTVVAWIFALPVAFMGMFFMDWFRRHGGCLCCHCLCCFIPDMLFMLTHGSKLNILPVIWIL